VQVPALVSFNTASFPDSLALAKEGSLTIGSVDAIQKLHIRWVLLQQDCLQAYTTDLLCARSRVSKTTALSCAQQTL